MEIGVLGTLEVNGTSHGLSRRDRVVLAALVLHHGGSVSRDALSDALWGEAVPDSRTKVLQGCIVRLRKLLGPAAIQTAGHDYVLRTHADVLDSQRFEMLVARARSHLADGAPDRAAHYADRALALWRGHPYPDLEEWPPGQAEGQRLEELRLEAEDVQTEAALRLGQSAGILGTALKRSAEAPLRERRWALLARAQYGSGRQTDALSTLRRSRAMLVNELGLDPSPELTELEAAVLRHDPDLTTAQAPSGPGAECPYPGLLPFEVEDAATFFGREADARACLERLDAAHVLAVVGPSGCGKSSLVRAGVAAALRRDGRRVLIVTPTQQPFDLVSPSPMARTVLVVDQCEEAFADDVDPAVRQSWVEALVSHSTGGDVVLAVRADRIGGFAAYPELARLAERGLYLLGAMQAPDLRNAIEGPAREGGLRLEPGLVDLLVREVQGEPGALPLLSHALRQTWSRREGATLTVAGYHASGGVREALTQSADGLYDQLDPPHRALLRDLMLRLVSPAPDGEPMRARMARSTFASDPDREQLVEQLVNARLVSADDASVEIAHEALAREWPRLRAWLDEDIEGQRVLRHLSAAAESWEAMERPTSELYRGVRLARALEWRPRAPALTPGETAFLDASERAAESERLVAEQQVRHEKHVNRRLRTLLAAAVALVVVAAGLGAFATSSARRANAQALAADARRVGAEALTAPQPDTSLLLAVAGVRLDDSSNSARANLAAALDRSPGLSRVMRTPPAGSMAVDPRTGRVAVSLTGGGLNVYDGRTLKQVGHASTGGGYATTYSPDGRLIAATDVPVNNAVTTDPQPVHLFTPDGQPNRVELGGIKPPQRDYWSLAFSADGTRVAAALFGVYRGEQDLAVWDTHDPGAGPVARLTPDEALMTSIALSADGKTMFTNGDYYLRVFDVATGRQRTTRTGPQLGIQALPWHDQAWTPSVVTSPDGRTLAVVATNEIALVDAATLTPRARIEAHGRVNRIAFSADGRRLAAADGGIVVWDVSRKQPTEVFRSDTWGGELVALSPDGTRAYAAGQDGELLAWDLGGSTTGFVTTRSGPGTPGAELMAQVSPDGTHVAYLENIYGRLDVRDVATGTFRKTIDPNYTGLFGYDLSWRPDGRVLVGVSGDGNLQQRDIRTGRFINSAFFSEGMNAAQYTVDGRLLVGTDKGRLLDLDARTMDARLPSATVLTEPVMSLTIDPALHRVLVRGASQRALIDYLTGQRLRAPTQMSFYSPDGSRTAVVDDAGAVGFLADHGTRWVAHPDPSHAYGDRASAFSHDSTWFASSRKGQVGLWNAHTGAFAGGVPVSGPVAVGFTADDATLVIAGFDGTVKTWNLRAESWSTAACAIAGRDFTSQEWAAALPNEAPRPVCPSGTS